ncbi:MAG: tyrosine-type recombinase/integrase [Nitrospinaceae bacterium]|nr:tyrosine-type recombinase/integrase [Nitrospinaceae bacterium]
MTAENIKTRKDRKVRGLYCRNGIWYIRIYHKGHDWRFSTGMKSKKAATQELSRAFANKAVFIAEKLADKERTRHMLSDWAKEYLVRMEQNGRRDMKRRRQCVDAFVDRFESRATSEISRKDVEIWREELKTSMGPASLNRHLAYARHLMSEGVKRGHIASNPFAGVEQMKEPPGRVRYLELEQAKRLLEECDQWFRPFMALGLETGCRKGELANLIWRDVDWKAGFIQIRHSKNGESRNVPLTATAIQVLQEISRRLDHSYVFSDRNGSPLIIDWENHERANGLPSPGLEYRNGPLQKALQKACKAAEIDNFRFHDARHHVGSWLAMQGVSMDARMAILGHKTERMARRYSHLSPDYIKGAMELFSEKSGTKIGTEEKTVMQR